MARRLKSLLFRNHLRSFRSRAAAVTILFPDKIPIWVDIQKISDDRADLGQHTESFNESSGFRRIFL